MKKKYMLFFMFLPSLFYFFICQFQIHWRQFLVAVVFSVGFIAFSGNKNISEKHRAIELALFKGLAVLAVILVFVSIYPVGGLLSIHFMSPNSNKKADAIIVLASGSTPSGDPGYSGFQRVSHGVRLYKEKRAPKLIISTGYSDVYGFNEFVWVSSFTSLLEVDKSGLTVLKDESIITTKAEGEYIKKHFPELKTILLVTSGSHIKRSEMVFRKKGFNVLPASTHDKNSVNYAYESYLTAFNAAIHEWIGLLYYKLRGYI